MLCRHFPGLAGTPIGQSRAPGASRGSSRRRRRIFHDGCVNRCAATDARPPNSCYSRQMAELLQRITSEPDKFGGRPCIRGLRIRVVDVLDLLAAGLSHAEIVEELPDLEPDDIKAALAFASRRVDHPLIAAE
jgi:uncharacterized protein (DUF433 family)